VNRVAANLRRIAADLAERRRRWALVGGLAVSARVEPRFTRDADVVVAVTDDRDAETLVRELQGAGYRALAVVEQEATARLATIRLAPPGERDTGAVVDLLFASSGIEHEVVAGAEPLDVMPGLTVPVASSGHLIALKVLSRDDRSRPLDRADLAGLLRVADDGAVDTARRALALIAARGYHRGRDLEMELDRVMREVGRSAWAEPPGPAHTL
jgi:hypothetical protein